MKHAGHRQPEGFSLIEVAIAFGVISFALVVLLALLPVGLSSSRDGSAEEAATELLVATSADIRNSAPNAVQTPMFRLPLNSQGEVTEYFAANGEKVGTAAAANFRLTVTGLTNDNPALRVTRLRVSWPPQASPPPSSVETLVMQATPPRQ